MDRYDASHDHYCYKGTSTLKNMLNIQGLGQLEVAEREVTTLTAKRIHFRRPPYNLDYLKALHRQLFSELYDWAGELRSVDISKGGTRFCTWTRMVVESQ